MTPAEYRPIALRYLMQCLDGRRIPLNKEERSFMPGDVPYWGAGGVVDSVGKSLFDEELVLLGEDGAPFFERGRDVSFRVTGPVWINNHIHVLRPKGIDARFLTYALNSVDFGQYITGSTRDKLTQEDMREIVIPVPSASVQFQTVSYLDRETAQIDELIEKQNALIALLGERRKAVITRAVTRGLDPSAPMEPSGYLLVPEVPTGWRVDQLGRLAAIGNGSTPNRDRVDYWDGGSIPWLNSSNVNRDVVTDSDQFVTDVARSESHLPMVPEGSLLVGLTGEGKTRGMVTILGIRATINQHLAYITPRSGRLQSRFLRWSLVHFYDALRELSNENGSTKGGLTCQALKQFRVPLPPSDVQHQIVEYLEFTTSAIDGLVKKAQDFIGLARERRSALITAAVTGKIDVRGVA